MSTFFQFLFLGILFSSYQQTYSFDDINLTILNLEKKEADYSMVREIQSLLTYCGYDAGQVDGLWGPNTAEAIRKFQKASGLPLDGLATQELLLKLKQWSAKVISSPSKNFQGSYRADKATRVYDNGDVYAGEFYGGFRHGFGQLRQKNGNVYEGYWFYDKRTGPGRQDFADGRVYDGEWLTNSPNGKGIYNLADGRVVKGIWEDGVLQSKASDLNPFGGILWRDSLAEIIGRLTAIEGVEKVMLSHSYNPAIFQPLGRYDILPGFVDVSAVKDERQLQEKLTLLTAETVEYYHGSSKTQGFLPWKEYAGIDEKFVDGLFIKAYPVYLEGVPFEFDLHLSPNPGVFLTTPEKTIKDGNSYLYAMILVKATLNSQVQLKPELYDDHKISDKWEEILVSLKKRHAYWYDDSKDFFTNGEDTFLYNVGFDKTWSEQRSIVYANTRYFQEMQAVWEKRYQLQSFSNINLSDRL